MQSNMDLTRGRVRLLSCTGDFLPHPGRLCDIDFILDSHYNMLYTAWPIRTPWAKNSSVADLQASIAETGTEQVRLLHRHRIPVITYVSATCMRTDSMDPERVERLAARDLQGNKIQTFYRWNEVSACINQPEWADFIADFVATMAEDGQVDGAFIDNVWVTNPCFCPICRAKFRHEVGEAVFGDPGLELAQVIRLQDFDRDMTRMPDEQHTLDLEGKKAGRTADVDFRLYAHYLLWRTQSFLTFLRAVRHKAEAQVGHPLILILNGHAVMASTVALLAEPGLMDAPYFEEGFNYPPYNNVYSLKMGHACKGQNASPFIVSRVATQGIPTPSQLKSHLGEGTAFGGNTTPWGLILHESEELSLAAHRHNRFLELYEEMLAGEEDRADVAVLYSWFAQLTFTRDNMMPVARSVTQLLVDMRVPFDLLLLEKGVTADQLRRYRLILLPELGVLDEATLGLLKAYTEEGGHLIAVGPLATYDGDLRARPAEPAWPGLVCFEAEQLRNRFTRAIALDAAEEFRARIAMFDPPTGPVPDAIRAVVGEDPLLETTVPGGVAMNLTRGPGFVNVHMVNYRVYNWTTQFYIPVEVMHHFSVTVKVPGRVREAHWISPDEKPMEQPISWQQEGDRVQVEVPALSHYGLVHMQLQDD